MYCETDIMPPINRVLHNNETLDSSFRSSSWKVMEHLWLWKEAHGWLYLKVETPKSLPWRELHPNYVHTCQLYNLIPQVPFANLWTTLHTNKQTYTPERMAWTKKQPHTRKNGMNWSECCTRKTMTKLPKSHKHSEQWGMMAGQKVWPHHGFFGPNVAPNDSNVFIVIATAISFLSHRFLRIWQNKFGHFSFVPFAHYCSILRIWQNKFGHFSFVPFAHYCSNFIISA